MNKFYLQFLVVCSLVIFVIALQSCTTCSSKKVTCGAFADVEFGSWFPYSTSLSKTYKNMTTGDTVTYEFNQSTTSPSYEINVGGFEGRSQSCASSASISANAFNKRDYMSVQYEVDSNVVQSGSAFNLSVAINQGLWQAGKINAAGFDITTVFTTCKVENINNFLFANGIVYPTFVTITNDTSGAEKPAYYKVFIAKRSGIIGYESYPSKHLWVVQ